MLNTLKTNLILTRAVLIALFAGLFILAACGGGGAAAPTTAGTPAANPCDTNPYGEGCNRAVDATARTRVYNACRDLTTTRTGADACENVPVGVINCLNEPFLATCNQTDLAAAGAASGAFLSLQVERVEFCREGTRANDDGQCTMARDTRCFDATPNIFDPLCSKSSVEGRTIIADCVDSATLATHADCADARNAVDVGVSCFQNPWDADCELLPDFANHLAMARTNRATYCADTTVENFNTSLCTTAMASVCADSGASANPFSALCTGASNTYDDERVAFATNCFNDANDGADCTVTAFTLRVGNEALCGNGDDIMGSDPTDAMCTMRRPVTVEACVNAPFSADCREVATFTGARAGLITDCTGVDSEFTIGCGQAGLSCLTNPFDDAPDVDCEEQLGSAQAVTDAQNNLITHCTGASASTQRCVTNVSMAVQDCLANPFDATCDTALGSPERAETAQNNIISLCTGADADGTNALCMTTSAGVDVATCLANPFETACDATLGSEGQADTAQTNILTLCTTADSDNFRTNTVCTGLTGNVKTCLDNPFTVAVQGGINCETDLGDTQAVMRAQANLNALCLGDSLTRNALCTDELKTSQFCSATADGANPFNVNCEGVTDIDTVVRTAFCTANSANDNCTTDLNTLRTTCSANPFAEECLVADSGYADNRVRAIAACNDLEKSMRANNVLCTDVEIKAAVTGENAADAVTLGNCVAEPFQSACADGAFDSLRFDARFNCTSGSGQAQTDACAIVAGQDFAGNDVTVGTCSTDPLNPACTDANFDSPRRARVDLCLNAGDRTTVAECDIEIKAMVAAEGNNPMIPAVTVEDCIDDPFNADCTDGAFDNARGTSYNTCANAVATDSATATTNADCIRDVVAGVPAVTGPNPVDEIPAVTVADCVADPFATGCVIDGFKDARNGICQSSSDARSFNAGCTVEDYLNIADTREDAIAFCRLNSDGVGCDILVSSETDAPTVAACATNPFTSGCDAELFKTAEQQVAYCAVGKTTIFDENCDDARPEVQAERDAAVRTCLANSAATVCAGTVLGMTPAVTAIAVGDVIDFGADGVLGGTDDTVATVNDVRAPVAPMPITLASCVADPYLSECTSISLFDNARFAHTEFCMRDGRADDAECMTLLGILSAETATTAQKARAVCITDPFASTCSGNAYSSAKTNRYAFCRDDAVSADAETDGLCGGDGETTGTTIVSEICSWNGTDSTTTGTGTRINPIAGICPDTNTLDRARYCGVGDRSASEDACGASAVVNVNTADGCLANPFSGTCTDYDTTASNPTPTITAELRTFLTERRTEYCTAVDAEGFDATLCQTAATDDNDFASTVCAAEGEFANPFADFCVREGRAENEFDDVRVTFVGNCKDFAANAVTNAFEGSGACTAEINTCIGAPFGTGTGAADCINENAYASLRQTAVNDCVDAFNGGTHATNADCITIAGVGQLTCITTNPYLNRVAVDAVAETTPGAGDGTDAVIGLNCLGNSNYDMVRTTLESDCASGGGGDSAMGADRCPIIEANVCGTGVDAAAVVGSNPFDTRYCFATDNTFNTQRQALIDSCDGTTLTNGCTAEINACVNNPFATTAIGTNGATSCQDASVVEFFADRKVAYCGLESTDNAGTPVANIDTANCQTHITTLGSGNICIANPFADACTNELLGGEAGETTQLEAAQELRTTYCSTGTATFTDTTSSGIRAGATNAYCRGAVDNFCKGDNLFASASGADVFNCLSDEGGTYNADRATHYELCLLNSGTRTANETDCTNAMAEICTTTNGLQTNPWAPICSEGNADATVARQTVINACLAKDPGTAAGQRGEVADTNVCTRTLGDLTANTDVAEILATCDDDPRLEVCTPFTATAGEGYAPLRLARYATSCAAIDDVANNTGLCPEQIVKTEICKSAGDNARPFAAICGVTTDGSTEIIASDILQLQQTILNTCTTTATMSNPECSDLSTRAVITACGVGADKNPFATTAVAGGFGDTVKCSAYTAFDTIRTRFTNACRVAQTGYDSTTCAKGNVIAVVCETTKGKFANPLSGICDAVTHRATRELFANACANPAGNPITLEGATCPAEVRNCATNPFNPGCTDVTAYNGQKRLVLNQCITAASTASGGTPRCTNALAQASLTCLKDPFNCTDTQADTQFAQAQDLGGTDSENARAHRDTVRQNRYTYCGTDANINSQKAICRTESQNHSHCLGNPFGTGCDAFIGTDQTAFRQARLDFCFGDGDAAANTNAKRTNVANVLGTARQALPTMGDVALCSRDGFLDAIGFVCYGYGGAAANGPAGASASAGDKSRDPFSAYCLADADYDARRLERIGECAGATTIGGTATMSTTSVEFAVGTTPSCNWAQQVNLCANNNPSTTSNRLDAQCGTLNIASKWVSATAATIAFTNSVGTANAFIDNLANTSDPIDFSSHATLEVNPNLAGRRVTDLLLPNVRFYSARTKAVAPGPAVTLLGQEIRLSNGQTQVNGATQDDIDNQVPTTPGSPAGVPRFFAGIELSSGTVGRPVFDRTAANATWTGKIDWIGVNNAVNSNNQARDFNMLVSFADRTLQGAVAVTFGATTGDHIVIDAEYSDAGIISGAGTSGGVTLRRYATNPNASGVNIGADLVSDVPAYRPGKVTGIIGSEGAVGVFINDAHLNVSDTAYGGGFIVKPQ